VAIRFHLQEKDMRQSVFFMKAALVLTIATGVAYAEEKGSAEVYRTPDLIGKEVKTRDGQQHLGYLEDLVVDLNNGRIAYAVLTTRGTVGFGGKMFALPLSAFRMAEDLKSLRIDAKQDEFENSEGFDANKWPEKVDERWMKFAKKEATRDTSATRDEGKERMLRRCTSLIGLSVKNEQAEDLGRTQGFAIDVTHGKIVYAALAVGGVAGVGAKYFAVPWNALQLKSLNLSVRDRCFVLNSRKEDFTNAKGFDYNNWPIKPDDQFKSGVRKEGSTRK